MMKNYFTIQGIQLFSLKSCILLFTLLFSLQSFSETDCGHITGFEFSNGNSTVSINNNQTYNINDLPNNFYVDLMVSGFTESASFKITNLSEDEEYFVGENYLPYTFPGGNGAWNFGTGNFKVEAKIFKYNQCQGYRCDKETIYFTLTNQISCGTIAGYEFSNGNDAVTIVDGASYDIDELPDNFYIDLLVFGATESAALKVTNLQTGQVATAGENHLPYTFPNGNNAWYLGTGEFQVKSEIFKYNYCAGSVCDTETIIFTLTESPDCGEITGFEFYNGTDASVAIVDGASYDFNNIPSDFNLNVLVSGTIESASNTLTNLNTGEVFTNLENAVPYTYPGATNQVWSHGCGTFKLCSSVYNENQSNGTECDSACITFTITGCCGEIDEFVFTDGTNSTTLVDGETYNISDLPTDFYIDALVAGDSESVRFNVTNIDTGDTYSIIENYIPYTFPAGNAAWNVGLGTFEVDASVFDGNYCTNVLCDQQVITFTLIDNVPCNVLAGTALPFASTVLITAGSANIEAVPNGDAVLEEGYVLGTVLTQGPDLIIQAVSDSTSISIGLSGDFTLHVLVYNPNTLDLSGIVFGETTVANVLAIIEDNGICAFLDAVGSPVTVISLGPDARAASTDVVITKPTPVKEEVKQVVAKEAQEVAIETVNIKLYPNPVVNTLNVNLHLLDGEQMGYALYDLNGRQVLQGGFDNSALGSVKIDTGNISNGLYILKFSSSIRTFSKKIQVNK